MSESLKQPSIDPPSPEAKNPKKRRPILLILVLAFFACAACGLFSLFFFTSSPRATTSERGADTGAVEESAAISADVDEGPPTDSEEDAAPADTPESAVALDIDPTTYIAASNMSVEEIPLGEPGLVVVVAGPPSTFGVLPIVIRNNTDSPVYDIDLSATARDASGAVVGTANGDDITPSHVPPGGLAVGRVLFGDTPLDGASIDYNITGDDEPGRLFGRRDLEILEHQLVGGNVVGLAINNHPEALDLTKVIVMCFDNNSLPTDVNFSFTDQESVEPGGELPFSIDLLGDEARCGRYLLAGSGRVE